MALNARSSYTQKTPQLAPEKHLTMSSLRAVKGISASQWVPLRLRGDLVDVE